MLKFYIDVSYLLHGNVRAYLFNLLRFGFTVFSLIRIFQQMRRDAHYVGKIRSLAWAFLPVPFTNFLPHQSFVTKEEVFACLSEMLIYGSLLLNPWELWHKIFPLSNEDSETEGIEDWPKVTGAGDSESHVLTTFPTAGASQSCIPWW